jgi:hypothetical protein
MSDYDKLMYARTRLSGARLVGNQDDIKTWTEHVKYWIDKLKNE